MEHKKVALVTGANKGIGYAIGAGLGELGFVVAVGARDGQRRDAAVASLWERGIEAVGVPLDVTDQHSVDAAAALIEDRHEGLDVLVNNAGITGGGPQDPTTVDPALIMSVIDTNVLGVVRVTNAMLPMLRRSPSPRIVNISSSVGSLTRQSGPGSATATGPVAVAYAPSKTFLNAVMLQYVKELGDSKILINAVCPGYVATDLNGHRGILTAEEGAVAAIRLATLPDDGPTGGFFETAGVVPW